MNMVTGVEQLIETGRNDGKWQMPLRRHFVDFHERSRGKYEVKLALDANIKGYECTFPSREM